MLLSKAIIWFSCSASDMPCIKTWWHMWHDLFHWTVVALHTAVISTPGRISLTYSSLNPTPTSKYPTPTPNALSCVSTSWCASNLLTSWKKLMNCHQSNIIYNHAPAHNNTWRKHYWPLTPLNHPSRHETQEVTLEQMSNHPHPFMRWTTAPSCLMKQEDWLPTIISLPLSLTDNHWQKGIGPSHGHPSHVYLVSLGKIYQKLFELLPSWQSIG